MKLREMLNAGLLPGGPIITPTEKSGEEFSAPIRTAERWIQAQGGSLFKRFVFQNNYERNRFVRELLDIEEEMGVHATIKVVDCQAMLALMAEGIGMITQREREFGNVVDFMYKDVIETTPCDSGVEDSEFLVTLGV